MNATDDWFDRTPRTETITEICDTEQVRVFLVTGTDAAVVVDAGRGIGDLRGLVDGLTDLPVQLVLTHWHWDHIGSAADFDRVRIHPDERAADGRVTIDAVTDEFVDGPAAFIEEWQADGKPLPDGFDPEAYGVDPVPADRVEPLAPGDEIDLGDRALEVLHIPGHTPGQIGLLDRTEGVLIGADVIHRDRGLKLHFETGDVVAALDTFDRLTELWEAGAFETLLTCHNEPIAGADLELLPALRDALQEIVDGERTGALVETSMGQAREYLVDDSQILTRVAG